MRFAVSKKRRELSVPATALSSNALVRGLDQISRMEGVTHWCAMMEYTLLRLLRSSGIHFTAVSPLVEFHGLRQSSSCRLDNMLDRMKFGQAGIWEYITSGGIYADAERGVRAAWTGN